MALLAYRARSERALRLCLQRDGFASDEIDAACARLRAERLLDDATFAEARAGAAVRVARSPRRVEATLVQQGVDAALARSAVATAQHEEGLDELALALRAGEKKLRSLAAVAAPLERQRRLLAYLGRQGYRYEVARAAVVRLCAADGASSPALDEPEG